MSKILDRNGLGAAISATQNDSNLDSLSGIVEVVSGTTYTVTIDDQNRTLEFTSGSAVAVTLTDLATILAALHTTSFKVTLKAVGAGVVTITRGSTDTFDDASTTQVLNQYDAITIQSDSTGAKWNVFNHPKYRTAATAGTVDASKAIVADANKDTTGHRNISATGLVAAGTLRGTIVDANANEVIIPGSVASAVNEVTITNAATGNDPSIAATGGDTNIDLVLSGKGSGTVLASTATITTANLTDINWVAPTIKSDGSQSIAGTGGTWAPPAGIYNFSSQFALSPSSVNFELYISGAWRASVAGTIAICDGTNMRWVNDSAGAITIYYQKMG